MSEVVKVHPLSGLLNWDHPDKLKWGIGSPQEQALKQLASIAWHRVKPTGDPELSECDAHWQEARLAETKTIFHGKLGNDTPFSHEVTKLLDEGRKLMRV
jgi:hypothetical protein